MFLKDLEIKEDEEEIRILKLQKEYKIGKIKEKDISADDYKKLIALYKKQNEKLKEKIASKRNKIRKKLDELKS